MSILYFGLPGNDCTTDKITAKEVGRFFRLIWCLKYNNFLEVQNIIYAYGVYLMEHIYFEAQLCINISNFKEISNIDILIILDMCIFYFGLPGNDCI